MTLSAFFSRLWVRSSIGTWAIYVVSSKSNLALNITACHKHLSQPFMMFSVFTQPRTVKLYSFQRIYILRMRKGRGKDEVGLVFNSNTTPCRRIIHYTSVSQPPGRGPLPGHGINYTGPLEVLLEFVILVF